MDRRLHRRRGYLVPHCPGTALAIPVEAAVEAVSFTNDQPVAIPGITSSSSVAGVLIVLHASFANSTNALHSARESPGGEAQ